MKLYHELANWWPLLSALSGISPEMIRVSRELNPECRHYIGDMREIDLKQQFDLVFIHDAILIKVKGQATRCEYDRAVEGIFPKKTWEALLRKVGFEVSFELIAHSELEPGSCFGIVGRMAT